MKKLIVVVMILVLFYVANAETLYNVTDLGGNNSRAYSINNNGQVVGEAKTESRPWRTAILFDISGGGNNFELGSTLSGNGSVANSINNNGQAVGIVGSQAVLFDTTGNNNDIVLGTLGGNGQYDYAYASAINDNGQIVGHSKYINNYSTAFFDQSGNSNNYYLGDRSTVDWSAINNSGQVVGGGYSNTPYNHTQAMLYDITGNGNNIVLGTFGGTYSYAYGINDDGEIVGRARYGGTGGSLNGSSHAALFDPSGNGNNIDLDPFGTSSTAYSINNNGQVVGTAGGYATMFDITGAGNNINLNDLINPSLGWNLKYAMDINDNGWIVGYGRNPNGDTGAYLLIPVPAAINIPIDIKPSSCPNPLNIKSRGVLPVAILGSDNFDVNEVDVLSIRLAGVAPLRSNYEDVATPLVDAEECDCSTEGSDGFTDLTLKFDTQAIVAAIGEVADGDELLLELIGELFDGTQIKGEDCIIVHAKSKSKGK